MANPVRAAPGSVIYLDYQATTPVAPEVTTAMRPWIGEKFANPHSPHRLGRDAAAVVEFAREQVLATLLSAKLPKEDEPDAKDGRLREEEPEAGRLLFTSGATEAANWALKGSYTRMLRTTGRRRIVTIATEHACVLDTLRHLEAEGAEVVFLPVNAKGHFDSKEAAAAIDEDAVIVAAMLVNNEIGVVNRVAWLGARAAAAGAVMFCDAVQGFGRMTVPVAVCDLVAVSAHKIHGPKGIGALWVRNGYDPDPLLHGGGQEGGIRSGTLSPALCVGFGKAAEVALASAVTDLKHVETLATRAKRALGLGWQVNGDSARRYRGNLNVRRDGLDAARLISELRQVAFSAGSACASGSGRPSHVLAAIGLGEREARASLRLGFGRYTTESEVESAMKLIAESADRQLVRA
ncbi:MAG: cysteine desulfurase family protein [Sphingosinicella sp.]